MINDIFYCTNGFIDDQLSNFHRPRLPIAARNAPMWFLNFESKGLLQGSASKKLQQQQQSHMRVKSSSQINSLSDLSLADPACEFVILEYVEEHPIVLSNQGMMSRIVNYYRLEAVEEPVSADQEDQTAAELSTGAPITEVDKHKSTIDAVYKKYGRIPRHFRCLVELSSRKSNVQDNSLEDDPLNGVPRLQEGTTEILNPEETFPLFGALGPN